MYRIELAPGEVTVFRTIDELATGVRNGVITARARIFHNATQKWLPVEFHPHYKLALELLAGRTIEVPSQKAVDGPRFDNIVTPTVSSQPSVAPGNLPYIALDEPSAAKEPAAKEPAASPFAPPWASPPAAVPPPVPPPDAPPLRSSQAASAYASLSRTTVDDSSPSDPPIHERSPLDLASSRPEMAYGSTSYAVASVAAAEDEPETAARPDIVASPVLDLPKISYPEFTPAEEPVAERASTSTGSRRSLHLASAIVVLVAGAYAARSAYAPAADSPVAAVAERPVLPHAGPGARVGGSIRAAVAPARVPTPPSRTDAAPAKSVPPRPSAPPASSGFAPALQARAIVSTPAPAASTPTADSTAAIEPVPAELDMSLPAPTSAESLVTPRQRGDSAMKRILRAVVDGKEVSAKP
jgi:hypothetical protein